MSDEDPVKVNCCVCDVGFYITQRYYRIRQKDHNQFFCPNGHGQAYLAATIGDVRDGKATFDRPRLVVNNAQERTDE